MSVMSEWQLEIEGERFETSKPTLGDLTEEAGSLEMVRGRRFEELDRRLSVGFITTDLPRLHRLIGKPGRIVMADGRELARVWLAKADETLNLAVLVVTDGPDAVRIADREHPLP